MDRSMGKASIRLDVPVEIFASASVVGTKEGQGPLKALFDVIGENDAFGAKTWEEAESSLQREAFGQAVRKAGIGMEEIRYLFAGDLLGQSMASSFGLEGCQIPYFGLYGACSTCGEALTLGAMTIAGGYADVVACVTSSHFASAEREFRFPLEYPSRRDGNAHERRDGKEGNSCAGKDLWDDGWKDRGLWPKGFHEHGGLHGTCRSGRHSAPFSGLGQGTGGL